MVEEEQSAAEIMQNALVAAKKAFFKSIDDSDYDGAYFAFDFRARHYGDDFHSVMQTASLSDYERAKTEEKAEKE